MVGPGIRYFEFARGLAKINKVFLAVPPGTGKKQGDGFKVIYWNDYQFKKLLRKADILISQGFKIPLRSFILSPRTKLIDFYDPHPVEALEHLKGRGPRTFTYRHYIRKTNLLIKIGDGFLCSNERQRDFWIGQMMANNKLDTILYSQDPELKDLLIIIPVGFPDDPPRHVRSVVKGVRPGIRESDHVILWAGGLWKWFDPFTAIKAMAQITKKRDDIKLLFLGKDYPNLASSDYSISLEVERVCRELGLLNHTVFFGEAWVDYQDRENYLLESELGLSMHFSSIETHFSFRTRILDYLWAMLPIICTEGDIFADFVKSEGLGIVVPERGVEALHEAILRLVDDRSFAENCKENIRRFRERFRWSALVEDLNEYCMRVLSKKDQTRKTRMKRVGILLFYYLQALLSLFWDNGWTELFERMRQRKRV